VEEAKAAKAEQQWEQQRLADEQAEKDQHEAAEEKAKKEQQEQLAELAWENWEVSMDILNFSFHPGHDTVNLIAYNHSIIIHLADTVSSGKSLTALFGLSQGATATVNNIPQTSGVTVNNFGNDLTYEVTAADHRTKKSWTVQASNNDYSIGWGLGHFLNKALSNDRNYEWYIDQATSGPVAGYNCGPSSVTMAIKWSDSSFTHTAAEAREFAYNGGGWWYTSDINSYLTKYSIPYATIALSADSGMSAAILRNQLARQAIHALD